MEILWYVSKRAVFHKPRSLEVSLIFIIVISDGVNGIQRIESCWIDASRL